MVERPRELAPPATAALDLSARVAALAGRLADTLASAGRGELPPPSFLREMATAAAPPPPSAAPLPIDRLARRLGLSAFELDLLVLTGMAEEHEGYAGVLRSLHPQGEPRPTAGLAVQLLCSGAEERRLAAAALEDGAAVRAGVLSLAPGPLYERSLIPGPALWPALRGLDCWPAALEHVREPVCTDGLDDWLASDPVRRCVDALAADLDLCVLVVADHPATAQHRGAVLAAQAGRRAARLRFNGAVDAAAECAVVAHCALRDAVPVVEAAERDGAPAALPALAAWRGAVVMATGRRAQAPGRGRPVLAVDVPRLSVGDRRQMWCGLVPELGDRAPSLAARYGLEPDAARAVAADARLLAQLGHTELSEEHIADGVRIRAGAPSWNGVDRIHPRATWDDLVLSPRQRGPLREAVGRILGQARVLEDWGFLAGRRGARGVRMLFAGPPGTGKTLSAEVMASALGVDLLVVDVSRVVSKWIGETEKNLARVFDAAEEGQAVLLFDEADALFGRRTDVSDAHDRYANLETAYLLSRIERFDGLTILSTNLRDNIDPAFVRRLEFIVGYDEPAAAEREALWRCHLPARAPLAADVDLAELAALYPVVGGIVRNAAVAAAFLAAAADDGAIGMQHFVHALRREYEKAGRAFPGAPR